MIDNRKLVNKLIIKPVASFFLGGIVADPTRLQRRINQERLAKLYTKKYGQKGGYFKNAEKNAEKQAAWLTKTFRKFT
jgi:hypothetical protein